MHLLRLTFILCAGRARTHSHLGKEPPSQFEHDGHDLRHLSRRVMDMDRMLKGEEDPSVISEINVLAMLLYAQGKLEKVPVGFLLVIVINVSVTDSIFLLLSPWPLFVFTY